MIAGDDPTPQEIERSLNNCARLIERGHEELLPYYEVLEEFLAEAKGRLATLARVRGRLSETSGFDRRTKADKGGAPSQP